MSITELIVAFFFPVPALPSSSSLPLLEDLLSSSSSTSDEEDEEDGEDRADVDFGGSGDRRTRGLGVYSEDNDDAEEKEKAGGKSRKRRKKVRRGRAEVECRVARLSGFSCYRQLQQD